MKAVGEADNAGRPRIGRRHVFTYHWAVHFEQPWRERMFLASGAFLVTFILARVITHAIHSGVGPLKNVKIGGAHIHHLVWGIVLLHINGYAFLAGLEALVPRRWAHRVSAIAFGTGAAMTLDEFALWLRLEDVYWTREGRKSVDAVAIFGALLSVGIWGGGFLHALVRDLIWLGDFERRHVGAWLQGKDAPEPIAQTPSVTEGGQALADPTAIITSST